MSFYELFHERQKPPTQVRVTCEPLEGRSLFCHWSQIVGEFLGLIGLTPAANAVNPGGYGKHALAL